MTGIAGLTNLSGTAPIVDQPNGTVPYGGSNYSNSFVPAPAPPPVQTTWTNQYGSFGSAAAAAAAARQGADTQAFYDSQIGSINNQMGQLDGQQNVGLSNIANSTQSALNTLNTQKGIGERNKNNQTETNTTNYSRNRSSIQSQTGARANALQRLLGINGAGNSSAAYEQVPFAAAKEGNIQLGDAQNAYATNQKGIDTAWQDLMDQYNTETGNVNQKRYGLENSLKQSIAQTRQSLLNKLYEAQTNRSLAGGSSYQQAIAGQAGLLSQINDLGGQITNLGNQYANPVIATNGINYKAPTLAEYLMKNRGAIQQSGGASQQGFDGTFNPLFNQQRDEFGNLIG